MIIYKVTYLSLKTKNVVKFYGTHQLQLKRDTRIFSHVIYTQCKLPSCIGLHAYSLLLYTLGSFLHAHACARETKSMVKKI